MIWTLLTLFFLQRAEANISQMNCYSLGLTNLNGAVSLLRDEWQTSDDAGYSLDLHSRPVDSNTAEVEISIQQRGTNVYSTHQVLNLEESPGNLVHQVVGEFIFTCDVK